MKGVPAGRPARRSASVVVFFVLTFAFTWATWAAVAAFNGDGAPFFSLGGPIFLLGVFGPGIVAVGLTYYEHGGEGVTRLVGQIGRWQVAWPLYLFAVGYMIATKLIAAVLHRIVLGAWPAFGGAPLLLILPAILLSTWVQAGEELGWRAYALPRLTRVAGAPAASLLLGAVWAVWHLPLFFMPGSDTVGTSFVIYLLHVIALSVAMAWLYWRTGGSLLLVMLMHAAVNNTSGLVPGVPPAPVHPFSFAAPPVALFSLLVAALVAGLLLPRLEARPTEG